jgi:FG-GAP-like repeat
MRRLLLWPIIVLVASHAAFADCANKLADHRPTYGTGAIAEVWFAEPTTRYQHYVLGSRYEAGSLCARMRDGHTLELALPETSVFEDRQPRLAELAGKGHEAIVVIHSRRDTGAAVAVIEVGGHGLHIVAETSPTGHARTWLNIAGIADFTSDGRPAIAFVQLPHAVGRLTLWQMRDGKLFETASITDTSNHVNGSRELGLSAVADFDGDGVLDLAIPSFDRRALRFLTFVGGSPTELARVQLRSRAATSFTVEGGSVKTVVVGLEDGSTQRVSLPQRR